MLVLAFRDTVADVDNTLRCLTAAINRDLVLERSLKQLLEVLGSNHLSTVPISLNFDGVPVSKLV